MSAPGLTCSDCSRALEEDPAATASRQVHWLLVEQPGAWGPDALHESRLPASVAVILGDRCAEAGVRVLLIRRGAVGVEPGRRRWAFVRASAEIPAMGGGWFSSPEELRALDIAGLATGSTPLPAGPDETLVAVCTHGRHDRCCADHGRPVVRALREQGTEVWECSHVGGDRFAANVVQFPHGLVHGRVTPASAPAVVAAYRQGRIHPGGFRGRGAWPPAVQAAEIHLRRSLDQWSVDTVALEAHDRDGARHRIRFAVAGHGPHVVTVDVGRDPRPRLLSCGNAGPGHPRLVTPVAIETG